jgi:Ras-related GTP-binding protein A/B
MENYLSQQRAHVFSNVGVLIYVFDIESRDVERDLATYVNIASALFQYSREAKIFVLVHKMDLIQPSTREDVFDNRVAAIRKKTAEAVAIVRKQKPETAAVTSDADLEMQAFATSIWDQSLYKAWASIIHDLVPNLALIEEQLANLGGAIDAEEILLFERTSFLVVSKWSSDEGECNPFGDRFERLSNILKSWKHTCSKFTGTPRNAEQFTDFEYKAGANFALFITKFTTNTYILVCMPPGEARFNSAKLNVSIARSWFRFLDGPIAAPAAAATAAPAAAIATATTSSSGPSQSTAVTSASGSGTDLLSGPSSET